MSRKNAIRRDLIAITDLCQAINSVEGADCSPEFDKQNKRICKTLYGFLIATAEDAIYGGATDKQLRKALTAAGWEDQTFVQRDFATKIVRD